MKKANKYNYYYWLSKLELETKMLGKFKLNLLKKEIKRKNKVFGIWNRKCENALISEFSKNIIADQFDNHRLLKFSNHYGSG